MSGTNFGMAACCTELRIDGLDTQGMLVRYEEDVDVHFMHSVGVYVATLYQVTPNSVII